jgi:hypothetical protein
MTTQRLHLFNGLYLIDLMIVLGHGVMRLISGPANADHLARRPWERNPASTI